MRHIPAAAIGQTIWMCFNSSQKVYPV